MFFLLYLLLIMAFVTRTGKGFFNNYIDRRVKTNRNFVAAITGSTGSGKSYSALREGEVLDETFDVDNICFQPKEFMNLINGVTKKLKKKGAVLVYDEIQVSHGHLDYRSMQSKMLNYVLQTFRHRNFILFMTSPHFSYINASCRKLFHCRMETVHINQKLKLCKLKPLLLQTNQSSGKIYQKYLRVSIKGQGTFPLKSINVRMPSKDLIKAYEEKKNKFTEDLNIKITKELNEDGDESKPKPLTTRQQDVYNFIKRDGNLKNMVKEFKIIPQSLKDHIEYINKKIEHNGEVIEPVKEGTKIIRYEINSVKVVEVESD